MKRFLVAGLLLLSLPALMLSVAKAADVDEDFLEGAHFVTLDQPQPTRNADKIEVVELFWYGCPHCYDFEPHAKKWLKSLPADVDFSRMPATFRPVWELHAKAYYAAELLGVLDKLHGALFHAKHRAKIKLDTVDKLASFFVKQGVAEADFRKTFNSFAVFTRVNNATQMVKRYGVRGVPSVIINGKYRVGSAMVNGYDEMVRVINYLIEKERVALKAKAKSAS